MGDVRPQAKSAENRRISFVVTDVTGFCITPVRARTRDGTYRETRHMCHKGQMERISDTDAVLRLTIPGLIG